MAKRYESQPNCPIAKTLDIVGERWSILILRDLTMGIGRFKEILRSLDGIPSNLLSKRLQRFEEQGIVERSFYSQHPPRAEYTLTAKGRKLVPLLRDLAEWGYQFELDQDQRRDPALRDGMTLLGVRWDADDLQGSEGV